MGPALKLVVGFVIEIAVIELGLAPKTVLWGIRLVEAPSAVMGF